MKTNRNKRYLLMLLFVIIGALLLVGCSSPVNNDNTNNNAAETMTVEELAEFDGKDGNKAYIAVDGVIYDVTDHPAWAEGEHNGAMAGKDITEMFENDSPHELDILDDVPVVGELE